MNQRRVFGAGFGLMMLLFSTGAAQSVEVDGAIHSYERVSAVSGRLSAVGSDTLNNVMTLWAEAYRQLYPAVQIQIEGKGSSTAPPALISATAQLGPMSRQMKQKEIDAFEKVYGYKPTRIRVAVDALAVYVNKDNPLDRLRLPQVDAIFSRGLRCGAATAIHDWGELGLEGSWKRRAISLYGRNSVSGTYGYFKKIALCKGDYRDSVKEQPGSAAVVQGVTRDLGGIGYSGIGYKTSGVKTLALARDGQTTFATTKPADVYSGKYPLARFLNLYINKAPGRTLDKLTEQFVRFALSNEGQQIVIRGGYLPLSAKVVSEELERLR